LWKVHRESVDIRQPEEKALSKFKSSKETLMTLEINPARKTFAKSKLVPALIAALLLSVIGTSPSYAAATQADVDYSQAMVDLTTKFNTVSTNFSKLSTKPPTWAMGKSYNAWKVKAIKSSVEMLAVINELSAVKGTDGFATSHPLLTKALANFKTGVTLSKTAINKNDSKTMAKANASILKGNSSWVAWSTAYAADVAALNG
jgi:hypothetical protein